MLRRRQTLTSVAFDSTQSFTNRVSRATTARVTEMHMTESTRKIEAIAQKKLPRGKARQNCRHALLLGGIGCWGIFGDRGGAGVRC
jgi:hypothetical protein